VTHNSEAQSPRGKEFPVDLAQPLELTIQSLHGDVVVRAVDRRDVLIGSGLPGHWHDLADDAELTIEVDGNRIAVGPKQRGDAGWTGIAGEVDLDSIFGQISKAFRFAGPMFAARARNGSGGDISSDIAIEVPRSMTGRIEVHSASGDVRVEGLSGEIALRTLSGDLRAVRTSGGLVLQTASGDLIVEEASGRLTARTASGDIQVTAAQLAGFETQTANGDILVDALLTDAGACRAHTASGDVRLSLRLPAGEGEEPAATLAFHTVAGDASVALPFRQIDRRRWQSGSGKPGPAIDVTTVNGDLAATIAATEHAFATAPAAAPFADDLPPVPPPLAPDLPSDWPRGQRERDAAAVNPETESPTVPDGDARLAVLEAVERGEIDVEEALRRLDVADAITHP
jgi:hypothetical protein